MKQVYFARPVGKAGPVKIGCSVNPERRVAQIASDLKEPLRIIATASGDFDDEQRLHRELAADRLHGEWFAASDAVMAVVDYIIERGELPPAETDRTGEMHSLRAAGLTFKQIAERHNVTGERVRQILQDDDYQPPRKLKAQQLAASGERIEAGALSFDPCGDVYWNEKPVHLDLSKRILVNSLLRARGATLSKSTLADRMGYEGDRSILLVNVHLCHIRKLAPGIPIKTVRGVGLRWAA